MFLPVAKINRVGVKSLGIHLEKWKKGVGVKGREIDV